MKTKSFYLLCLLIILVHGCKLKEEDDISSVVEPVITDQSTTIRGIVKEHVTSSPVDNALVRIEGLDYSTSGTVTNSKGEYEFKVIISNALNIKIIAEKEGYQADTVSVNIAQGSTIQPTDLRLKTVTGNLPVISDKAASIYLFLQSTDKLGIKESGNIETAIATFQVIDSSGIPINSNRAVDVEFEIIAGPGGGEFLYPTKVKTNEKGQATTAITCGNKAGVMQVEAKIVKDNITIRSKPIFFTIYGGFPVQERFAVAAPKLNYSYYSIMNEEITFTALLGDKYSNPVRPNTAVYFETTDGVIGNFKYTDILGRATSVLATFGFPNHAVYGPGFFLVTASTSTETSDIIYTSTLRLLSHKPIITNVSPTTFNILNGGSQTFSFTAKDFNGNPVSSEHTITFETKGDLSVSPSIIRIPDALYGGPGITEFTFTIGDAKTDEINPSTAAVIITINGPFGTTSYSIDGNSQ